MEENRIRVRVIIVSILLVLTTLGFRLAHLQLLESSAYSGEARSMAVREKRVTPARGAIYDRNGVLMVDNEFTYTITITPRYFDEKNIPILAQLLEVPDSLVSQKLQEAREWSSFQPSRSFREVPFRTFSRIQETFYTLPGVSYEEEQKRRYLTDAHATHILGYTREISATELSRNAEEGYKQGDLIGKTGLEKSYEENMRGAYGSELRMVNVHGMEVGKYQEGGADIPPSSGFNLQLTIDSDLQALGESLFVNKRGAAVALDPNNGEILAMLSIPDLDPEILAKSLTAREWYELTSSEASHMFNRATMSMMPPGSTWKPFMSLMALQEGIITPNQTIYCGGGHPLGRGRRFRCLGVHGNINVRNAILHSCNTFYFEVMRRIDVNTFNRYAKMFGFGDRIASDLGEQLPGLIPDSTYYNRTYPRGWTVGYSMNLGIGQGDMGVTAMQLARYVAAIASNGKLHTPHLVRNLHHPESDSTIYPEIPPSQQVPIDSSYFSIVKTSMRNLMQIGGGRYFQIPDVSSAGKTGTAQAPGDRDDHSLFVMFAPRENPQIALAVIVENGGFGGTQAGPIATMMAEQYLTGKISDSPNRQWLFNRILNELESQPL
ncbi:MAG: penicillin-binding protein 2 [Rhodothermaceae bacterium]|nr:penicillin-binding protein 2 [Rhodothermaceae bacterium]